MKTEQQQGAKHPPSKLTLAFTVITHVLLLAPILYIVGLGFQYFSFFSWHPICMSLGAGLLLTEAVFSISGEAFLSQKLSRANRITIHWILHVIGLCLILCGLVIIIVNKNRYNKYHFVTPHSKLGLSTIVLTSCVALFGIVANNTKWLSPRVRPILIKVSHAFGGIAVTILLLATVINGTYTNWWPDTDTGRSLVFASLFIAGVLLLFKPILGAISRTRVILKSSPPMSS